MKFIEYMSYVLGFAKGKGHVVISDGITCADDGEGNITITETEE